MKTSNYTKFVLMLFLSLFSFIFFYNQNVIAFDEDFSSKVVSMIKKDDIREIDYNNPYQTKRLIVKTNDDITTLNAIDTAKSEEYYILQFNTEDDTKKALEYYDSLSSVEYVEPDTIFKTNVTETNSYVSWGAGEMGISNYTQYLVSTIGKNNLNEVIIAVLDTGIDTDHEWFSNRIYNGGKNYSSSSSKSQYSYEDVHGHGTHVSGIIVDLTLSNVKILPIKVMNDEGYGYASTITLGIDYVTSLKKSGKNIYAMNLSIGGASPVGSKEYNLYSDSLQKAYSSGILPIVAAGNDGVNVINHTPANVPCAVTVSAVAKSGSYFYKPSWSNYGELVDVSAPGNAIVSASVGGGVVSMSGTSMAAPHVSAAVALLNSDSSKQYTLLEIENLLDGSAIDLGDVGWDKNFGEGMVNLQYAYAEVINDIVFSNTVRDHYSSFKLMITSSEPDASIYYTLDGTIPSLTNGTLYTQPITISHTTKVSAVAYVLSSSGVVKYSKMKSYIYCFYGDDVTEAYLVSEDGTLESYVGVLKEVILPKEINGITITKIGKYAFSGTGVVKITLPSTVVEIGDYAFFGLTSLQEINAPSVTSVGMYAFNGCSNLKYLNDKNFPKLLTIGKYAFNDCGMLNSINLSKVTLIDYWAFGMKNVDPVNLTSINLPSVITIGEGAFIFCKYLSEVNLPSVEVIASDAFRECDIINLYLPSLKYLGSRSFYVNENLLTVDMPNVETIGDSSFYYYCTKLHTVNIPKVKKIGSSAFRMCSSLEYIEMPEVVEIATWAFYDCDKLKGFYAPKLRNIAYAAFGHLNNLEEVSLPSIIYIANDAFRDAPQLEEVELSSTIASIDTHSFSNINETAIFYIYSGTVAESFVKENNYKYVDLANNELFSYKVKDNEIVLTGYLGDENNELVIPSYIGNLPVTKIANNAFENLTNIYSLNSSTLVEIGENAFYNCVNLKNIYLHEAKFIRKNAFYNCVSLYDVIIPEIVQIEEKAFYGCSSLLEISLPSTIELVGEKSLGYNKDGLIIPVFVIYAYESKMIESYVKANNITLRLIMKNLDHFYYNYYTNNGVQEIYISFVDSYLAGGIIVPSSYNGVTISKIGARAFYNCNLITEIILPSSIKHVGEQAFEGCSSLHSINLESIISIEKMAFKNCHSLKSVNMPLVSKIPDDAFNSNSSLTFVNIPSVISIGENAFSSCYELEEIVSTKLVSIGWAAFTYDYKLKKIDTLNVTTIGSISSTGSILGSVFAFCSSLEKIYLPKIEILAGSSFTSSGIKEIVIGKMLNKYDSNPFSDNMKVYGYKGTEAERLCNDKNITFIIIDELSIVKDLPDSFSLVSFEMTSFLTVSAKGYDLKYKWFEMSENNSGLVQLKNTSNTLQVDSSMEGNLYFVRIINWDGSYVDSNVCHIIFENINKYTITVLVEGNGEVEPGDSVVVYEGENKKFTFRAFDGYIVSEIIIDNVYLSDSLLEEAINEGYIFNSVKENHTIKVIFTKKTYVIQASLEGYGAITPKGKVVVEHGASQKFEIDVVEGYHIESIFIGSVSLSKDEIDYVLKNGYTFTDIRGSNSIHVVIKINVFTIKTIIEGNGKITPYGDILIEYGESKNFKFEQSEGYDLVAIIIDDTYLSDSLLEEAINEGYTFYNVKENHILKVVFERRKYTIDVEKQGFGVVDFIDDTIVYYGESRTYKFIANEGYEVSKIVIDGIELTGDEFSNAVKSGYTFNNVQEDHSLSVIFSRKSYIITASIEGNGTISPSGEVIVKQEQTFIITIAEHYHIESIFIGSKSLNEEQIIMVLKNGYTFENIVSDSSIKVIVEIDKYNIIVDIEGNGNVSPEENQIVNYGDNKHFSFEANSGYQISSILIDNKPLVKDDLQQAINEGYIFSNVDKNHTVKVVFVKKKYIIQANLEGYGAITPKGSVLVEHGANQKFEIDVVEGYHIESIFIGSMSLSKEEIDFVRRNGYVFKNIKDNNSIQVVIERNMYVIETKVEGNGRINPNSEVVVEYGENKRFTFETSKEYGLTALIVDGVYLSDSSLQLAKNEGYTFENIKANHTIEAVFKKLKYVITLLYEKDENVSTNMYMLVNKNDSKIFKFNNVEGYYISDILLNDVSLGVLDTYELKDIMTDYTIKVVFVKKTYEIDVEVLGEGTFECEDDLSKVGYGSNIVINLIADNGYKLDKVWVDKKLVSINDNSLKILNVIGDHEVTITFEEDTSNSLDEGVASGGLSCSKNESVKGSFVDFMFVMITILGIALPKKRIYK